MRVVLILVLLALIRSMAGAQTIFADGFESGSVEAWSAAVGVESAPIATVEFTLIPSAAAPVGSWLAIVANPTGHTGPIQIARLKPNGEVFVLATVPHQGGAATVQLSGCPCVVGLVMRVQNTWMGLWSGEVQ